MFQVHDIHRFVSAAAPLALVCAAAIPQDIEKRGAPVPAAALQDPVAPWIETADLIGRAVVTTKGVDDASSSATVGKIADLVLDVRNFTLPFLVVDVVDGPRTAVAWHAAAWNAMDRTFTVGASAEELRSRAEIEPDHLDRLLGAEPGIAGVGETAEAGAKKPAEAVAAEPLPRVLLASQIAGLAAQARDGTAFGKIDRVLVDPVRGDVPVMVVAVGDHLHVVPGTLASIARTDRKTTVLRLDRDANTLLGTPRLDREDTSLADPSFRAKVLRAVGLTPRGEPGSAADRR